jgi:hypothetical protein
MPNTPVPAAAEGLPKVTRRMFLRQGAVAGVAAVAVAPLATAESAPRLTPDERIATALAEIKAAYHEKFPGAPIRICTHDNGDADFVMVIPFPGREKTGVVTYMRNCEVVRREGGAA